MYESGSQFREDNPLHSRGVTQLALLQLPRVSEDDRRFADPFTIEEKFILDVLQCPRSTPVR